MSLPVAPVRLPADLIGVRNGKLSDELLQPVPGWGTGQRLHRHAARAWQALHAAAHAAGLPLTCTDTYRPLAEQESLFRARYSPNYIAGRPSKRWHGQTWWLLPGNATAATPGNSNHGLGLAVDVALELDGDPEPESLNDTGLSWLLAHAPAYGWSWELQSEPWHLRFVAGDTTPPALAAAAHDTAPDPTPTSEEDPVLRKTTSVRSARAPGRRVYAELDKATGVLTIWNGAVRLPDWPTERTSFRPGDEPWFIGEPIDLDEDSAELTVTTKVPTGERFTYSFPIVP